MAANNESFIQIGFGISISRPLFAALSNEAVGGNMYEPDEGGLRGYPVKAIIQGNAMNEEVAERLWDLAERITDIYYPI